MKQVLIGRDGIRVVEVPAPGVEAGTVLVRTACSCISSGTELSGVQSVSTPLWHRVMERPQQIQQLVSMVREKGIAQARAVVSDKLASAYPLGYSLSGTVVAVGEGVTEYQPGDRVACAGSEHAFHAEVVQVPTNLIVPVPKGVTFAAASTVALGAIALQGVRRAEPTLGERFVVVGLGLLGQLVAQILKANGCSVIGMDPDAARAERALSLGMAAVASADDCDPVAAVSRWCLGEGADGVIVTAASPSEELLNTAFQMCRRKGRVVLVGDVPINIDRSAIYPKELDFRISTSYGPGRYDGNYEERGLDYPIGYVRWTAGRNMQTYLELIASGALAVEPLIDTRFPVESAAVAYEALKSSARPLVALLTYPETGQAPLGRRVDQRGSSTPTKGGIQVAVVGPGGFFRGTLLPILKSQKDRYAMRAVVSRNGHNAQGLATLSGASYATTDLNEVLADPDVNLLIVATRHNQHADLVLRGLQCGKAVFVEKPLALTAEQLAAIDAFFAEAEASQRSVPLLMTGFNRRFSPHAAILAKALQDRRGPLLINYRVNAPRLPSDHWVHGPEGGGRNLGEACHFYDLMTFLTGADVLRVEAVALDTGAIGDRANENFVATVTFADGSVGSLSYTSLGSQAHPKERIEIFCDGKVFDLEDFKTMRVSGRRLKAPTFALPQKGHTQELDALAAALDIGGQWPIPYWQQRQATQIALDVERRIGEQSVRRGDV